MAASVTPNAGVGDPHLDGPHLRGRFRASSDRSSQPQCFQRLVANPFLAACSWTVALGLVGSALDHSRFDLACVVLVGTTLSPLLMEYHCRDCGRTGRLLRWKRHACDTVLLRRATGQSRRFRGPPPSLQAVIWLILAVWLGSLFTFL